MTWKQGIPMKLGAYAIRWVDGGCSVASVYQTENGTLMLAPSNWLNPSPLMKNLSNIKEHKCIGENRTDPDEESLSFDVHESDNRYIVIEPKRDTILDAMDIVIQAYKKTTTRPFRESQWEFRMSLSAFLEFKVAAGFPADHLVERASYRGIDIVIPSCDPYDMCDEEVEGWSLVRKGQ